MNIFCMIIGAYLGGLMSKGCGAVFGAVLGWFCYETCSLRGRIAKLQSELTWLRRKVTSELMEFSEEAPPEADVEPEFVGNAAPLYPESAASEADAAAARDMRFSGPVQPASRSSVAAVPVATVEQHDVEPEFEFVPETPVSLEPSAMEAAIRKLFSSENLLVKLGVLILFFGVSFLVKYAAQRGLLPIELRLTGTALGGCALLATGWRLREQRPAYAQVIQGGGVGILYLTTYAALHLYHLIPAAPGFALLVAICALSAVLAVAQDAMPLAVMGSAGGFLAPELAGIGNASPVSLFGYYAVLNCGILAIARLRAWRELNLLGFAGTFVVSALWGARFYHSGYFYSVEPFLVMFFLIYTALPVLYARQRLTKLDGYVDCTLVFGTPLLSFALQAGLVRHCDYGLAWSALAAGVIYLALATWLFRSLPERMRGLAEAFLALGTVFCTLAIPLAFEGRWTSAAWSLEGAALIWAGLRQERLLARAFGYLLLVGSGVLFWGDAGYRSDALPVLNAFYSGCLLISGAAVLSAWLLNRGKHILAAGERLAEPLLFAWGLAWWGAAGMIEVCDHVSNDLAFGALLTFVAFSCLACDYLGQRLAWRLPEWPALGLLPLMAVFATLQQVDGVRMPSLNGGWFGWPVAFTAWYLILYRDRLRRPVQQPLFHAAPWWLLTALLAGEASLRIQSHLPGMETWAVCAWGVVPALMILMVARYGECLPWPVKHNVANYLWLGAAPLAVASWLWLLYANLTQAGNPGPFPYLPLLNPLDGAILLVLVSLAQWLRSVRDARPDLCLGDVRREAIGVFSATLFVWLNAVLLRTIHHWCGTPFTAHDLFASQTVQATLSICWCLVALTAMTIAARRELRQVWLAGAGLLGAVVAKLFLVDLAGHGSLARIISFVVVGLLMLLIGWLSPVPPRSVRPNSGEMRAEK